MQSKNIGFISEHVIAWMLCEEFNVSTEFSRMFADEAGLPSGEMIFSSAVFPPLSNVDDTRLLWSFIIGEKRYSALVEVCIGKTAAPAKFAEARAQLAALTENPITPPAAPAILTAPAKFLKDHSEAQQFNHFVSFEKLFSISRKTGGSRQNFRAEIYRAAALQMM